MAQLYPPYLNEVLPAFAGSTMKIPFTMNPAVSTGDIGGFVIRIKNVNSNSILHEIVKTYTESEIRNIVKRQYLLINGTAIKNLAAAKFYKIQIAYKDKSTTTPINYSSAALIKKCIKPTLSIENLSLKKAVEYPHIFTGVYEINERDAAEKLYNSEFIIRNARTEDIVYRSGVILHDITSDTNAITATEKYTFPEDLKPNVKYTCEWKITTVNGYVGKTDRYQIVQTNGIQSSLSDIVRVQVVSDPTNGRLRVRVKEDNTYDDKSFQGPYKIIISRSSLKDNYLKWHVLKEMTLKSNDEYIYNDYSIENGETYKYSIQTYEDSFASARISSQPTFASFEDMFIWDGKKQLRVPYNSQLTNLKPLIQEAKIETLGGKYPLISRNGNINYKEFSISGILTYLSDQSHLFISKSSYPDTLLDNNNIDPSNKYFVYETNNSEKNVAKEKAFKNYALSWLTNGKPKLLRTPTEGNFLVRLMNSSLNNFTTDRMIHSFSATACEIDDSSIEKLKKWGIINDIELQGYQIKKRKNSYSFKSKDYYEKKCKSDVITKIKIKLKTNSVVNVYLNGSKTPTTVLRGKGITYTSDDNEYIEQLIIKEANNKKFSFDLTYYFYTKTSKSVSTKTKTYQTRGYPYTYTQFKSLGFIQNLEKLKTKSSTSKKQEIFVSDIIVQKRNIKYWDTTEAKKLSNFKECRVKNDTLYINRIKSGRGYKEKNSYLKRTVNGKAKYYWYKNSNPSSCPLYAVRLTGSDGKVKTKMINLLNEPVSLKDLFADETIIDDYSSLFGLYFGLGVNVTVNYQIKTYNVS